MPPSSSICLLAKAPSLPGEAGRENYLDLGTEKNDELVLTKRRLEAATTAGRIGIWEILKKQEAIYLNDVTRELLGFGQEGPVDLTACFAVVHPEDLELAQTMLRRVMEHGETFEYYVRVLIPAGEVRCLRVSNSPLRSVDGEIIGAVGTLIDCTTQHQQAEQHRLALETAEAAVSAKSDFLARMSHEIRTPMNAIIAPAQLLSETPLISSQRDLVAMIQRAGEHLLDVINSILDFSKLEAGMMPLYEETFHMQAVTEEILAPFAILAVNKELTLVSKIDPDAGGHWVGDVSRVRQILLNLVSNAVKYTQCGEVAVEISRWPGDGNIESGLEIRVRDSGSGLSLQETERIFLPFEQSPVGASGRPGGTGLGLAICRELVDLMGGILGVESTPGEGSVFWFCIPLREADSTTDSMASEVIPDQLQVPWISPPHVLVVEDNPSNRKVVSLLLKKIGCTVSLALDGQQALDALLLSDFDLILMDCEMPVMDGYDCTVELRKREEFRKIRTPVIALSAHVTPEHKSLCLASGMDEVLSKPISLAELRDTCLQWVPSQV